MWPFQIDDTYSKMLFRQNHVNLEHLQSLKWDLYSISETNFNF